MTWYGLLFGKEKKRKGKKDMNMTFVGNLVLRRGETKKKEGEEINK